MMHDAHVRAYYARAKALAEVRRAALAAFDAEYPPVRMVPLFGRFMG